MENITGQFKLKRMSNINKENIISDIKRVDRILNKQIFTKKDYCRHAKVSANTILNYFGSWHNALTEAGLANKSSNRIKTDKLEKQFSKNMTDEEIIKEIKNIAKKLNKSKITGKDMDENSNLISRSTVRSRFGWKNGLKLANLEISTHGKRYTDEECFNNLLDVWTYYGRQPTSSEMNKKPSIVGSKAYTKRWGSWLKALESFVKEVEKDNKPKVAREGEHQKQKIVIHQKTPDEDKRDVKLGLRYKVLVAGHFKCAKCGRSPATSFGLELEIDHKIPFSKGGKTIFENLQVLCKDCNSGKSDRHLE